MSLRTALGVVLLALLPAVAAGFSTGPPANRNKICGVQTNACTRCHQFTTPTMPTVELKILDPTEMPLPPSYVPNRSYTFLLRAIENDLTRCAHPTGPCTGACGAGDSRASCVFGFEFSAVLAASCPLPVPNQAGCLTPIDTVNTRCINFANAPCGVCPGSGELQFLEHTNCGIQPTISSALQQGREWTFTWTAPPPGSNTVSFFYAVNFANGSCSNAGDAPFFCADTLAGCPSMTEEAPSACDLRKGSVTTLAPPIDKAGLLFGDHSSCAPAFVPATTSVAGFSAAPDQDLGDSFGSGDPLIVYEVLCPCAGTLYTVKNVATGRVHARLQ